MNESEKFVSYNYETISRCHMGDANYVLGENQSFRKPYAVWQSVMDSMVDPQFFETKEEAYKAFFERSAKHAVFPEQKSLGMTFLTPEEKEMVYNNLKEQTDKDAIKHALLQIYTSRNFPEDVKDEQISYLLNNESFVQDAAVIWNASKIQYDKRKELLDLIVNTFLTRNDQVYNFELRLPPEYKTVMDDILNKTWQEVGEKYGATDEIYYYSLPMKSFCPGLNLYASFEINYRMDNRPFVDVFIRAGIKDSSYIITLAEATYDTLDTIEGTLTANDERNNRFEISIAEDKTLERIGHCFMVHNLVLDDLEEASYQVKVLRLLGKDDAEILASNHMYEAEIINTGERIHIWDDELSERIPDLLYEQFQGMRNSFKRESIDEKINSAEKQKQPDSETFRKHPAVSYEK